jgi:hypothetical protein
MIIQQNPSKVNRFLSFIKKLTMGIPQAAAWNTTKKGGL